MELLKRELTSDEYQRALASWFWLDDLHGLTPMFASLFGDVFLASQDGGRWYLDTIEGSLTRAWANQEDMAGKLQSVEGIEQYLLAGLAEAAARKGLTLGRSQIYDFEVPPRLGGPIDLSNINVMEFVVGVNLAGQLHEQLHDLPPGTPISGFTLEEPDPPQA